MGLEQIAFFFLAPALYLMFALVSSIAVVLDRDQINSRWAAVGFAMAIVGLLLDALRPPGTMWLQWLADALHWSVLLCMVQTFTVRWRIPSLRMSWMIWATTLLLALPPWAMSFEPRLRFLLVAGGVIAILLPLVSAAIRRRSTHWIDRAILAVVTVVILGYCAIFVFACLQPDIVFLQEHHRESALNKLFNVVMGINGAMVGVLMVIIQGADSVERQRLLSQTDVLTGLGNRLALAERMAGSSRERPDCAAVIAIDLDHFKRINDQWGHAMGDEVLRRVGARLRDLFADHAQLLRIGGEEFLMLLPQASAPAASQLALSVREAIASIGTDQLPAELAVTASVGVAVLLPGESVEAAMRRADQAVYCAKASGRNRVIAASASQGLMTLRAVA